MTTDVRLQQLQRLRWARPGCRSWPSASFGSTSAGHAQRAERRAAMGRLTEENMRIFAEHARLEARLSDAPALVDHGCVVPCRPVPPGACDGRGVWLGIALTAATLLVSGVYAPRSGPTRDEVDDRIDEKQAPVAAAVQNSADALKDVAAELRNCASRRSARNAGSGGTRRIRR